MAEYKGFDLLDALVFMAQQKKRLAIIFIVSLIGIYLLVYVGIKEQYEATAVIIPSEDDNSAGISSMLKGLKGLPINLGGSSSSKSEINRYNTIIYSRTTAETIIRQYQLFAVYNIDTMDRDHWEEAIKKLRKDIVTNETKEDAFEIMVRSDDPHRSAAMVNSLIELLNQRIIQLKVSKSRENRLFLEKRMKEISDALRISEDSMKFFQERSGLIDIKSQLPELMTVYSSLEADLMAKQLKRNILENMYDKSSPDVKTLDIEISEYNKKLSNLRRQGEKGSLMIAMSSLPKTALEYLRKFRQVEINSTLLEIIMPMYEQAKIEEKKDYPILQVIDPATPPTRKSWPPRSLFALLGAIFVTGTYLLSQVLSSVVSGSTNPKIAILLREFSWSSFRSKP